MNKKFLKFILLPALLLTISLVLIKPTQAAESIKEFNIDAQIQPNSSVLITEQIIYDFGDAQRHGIYRNIPTDGIKIDVKKVTDEHDARYRYTTSRSNDNLRIKIGDPDTYITGIHIYNITYDASDAIGFYDEYDVFYWNVTGNEWQVPIERVSARVSLPQTIDTETMRGLCFTGTYGSTDQNCTWDKIDNKTAAFATTQTLSAYAGLSIALGWPIGIVARPTAFDIFLKYLWKYVLYLLPILVLIYLIKHWFRHGRDVKLDKLVIAQYEPPDKLRPAEVGLLDKKHTSPRHITATIIDLAVRKHIKIKEIGEKGLLKKQAWELILIKDYADDTSLLNYERYLLDKIFGSTKSKKISKLKNKFYKSFAKIKKQLKDKLRDDGYFFPTSTDKKIPLIGVAFFIATFIMFFISLSHAGPISISTFMLFLYSTLFTRLRRNQKGAEAHWVIKGFEEYIDTAEKHRSEFYEKAQIFEEFLPYAIIFDKVDKWAGAFKDIYTDPPDWYQGTMRSHFNTIVFASALNSSLKSMSTNMISRPGGSGSSGFGGGGFSGGGGGGGGGGSW